MSQQIDWSEFTLQMDNATVIVPCLVLVLYMDHTDGHIILDFYQRAREALGTLITHYNKGNKRVKLTSRSETIVPTWCKTLRPWPDKNYDIYFYDCDGKHGITSTSIEVSIFHNPIKELTSEEKARRIKLWEFLSKEGYQLNPPASTLRVTLPLNHTLVESSQWLDWILNFEAVKNWPFLSGHCGYALNYFDEVGSSTIRKAMNKRLASLTLRYPGLDCEITGFLTQLLQYDSEWTTKTGYLLPLIKRVNWLTLISNRAIDYLGGRDVITSAFVDEPPIKLHPLKEGLVIQAGDVPQLGDIGHRDFIPVYRSVAKVLRQVRLEKVKGLRWGEAENEWLNALDKNYD
jgi:hypothetical protein